MRSRELKALRVKNGHTQAKLGEMMNMGETTYCKKENGQIDFTLSEVKMLKDIYKLSQEDIEKIFFSDDVAFETTNLKRFIM